MTYQEMDDHLENRRIEVPTRGKALVVSEITGEEQAASDIQDVILVEPLISDPYVGL